LGEFRCREICPAEVRTSKIRLFKICIGEVRLDEGCFDKISVEKVCPT
jgi:hypothetical protein